MGELQTQEKDVDEGKAEHQNHHDPDHFQVFCGKAEGMLRERRLFLLGSLPPLSLKSLGKNRSEMKDLIK